MPPFLEAFSFPFSNSQTVTALFLLVSVLSVLAAISSSPPNVWASQFSTLTATSYVTFYNGTATATVVRVFCATTVTETLNVTTTLLLPNQIITAYVAQATARRTVEFTGSTLTSMLTLGTCFAFSQRFVATSAVTGPLYVYAHTPHFDLRALLVGSLVAGAYIASLALCAIAFFRRRDTVVSALVARSVSTSYPCLFAILKRLSKVSWCVVKWREISFCGSSSV